MKKIKLFSIGLLSVLTLFVSAISMTSNVFANSYNTWIDEMTDQDVSGHLGELFIGKPEYFDEMDLDKRLTITQTSLKYDGRTLKFSDINSSSYMNLYITGARAFIDEMTDQDVSGHLGELFIGKSEYFDEMDLDKKLTITQTSLKYDGRTLKFSDINSSSYMNLYIETYLTIPDSTPAISGEHTVVNDIDAPMTEEQIRDVAELQAIDDYFGDITEDIEVVEDNYTDNKNKVGVFEITYKVTNEAGLSTTFVLKVSNHDLTAPIIDGPGTSTISYTEQFETNDILDLFEVTDNYDSNVTLKVDSTDYKKGVPGKYQFKLSATDKAGNKATFTHTMTVIDDVKPNFSDENTGTIEVNWKDKVTNEMLLVGLTADDKIDGNLTDKIKITDNPITNKLGKYTVKYEVSDNSGNKATYSRTYKVITTDAPIFWVSNNLLLISEVNKLTNDQLAQELARYHNINMASYSVVQNDYENNENMPGEYSVRLAIADNTGEEHMVERTVKVFESSELPEEELGLMKKIGNFFISIWNFIVKMFTWIWNAIKWVFDLLFGWLG